jgi:hypothetical protein
MKLAYRASSKVIPLKIAHTTKGLINAVCKKKFLTYGYATYIRIGKTNEL